MLTPIRKELFSWGTPDPESDWMMFGHLLVQDSGCILFDPPLVPGLMEALTRLGGVNSVVLTTLEHSRAAAHIVRKTGALLYLPDQQPSDVNPMAFNIHKQITDYKTYSEGNLLGLRAFRLRVKENMEIGMPSMNEYAILTDKNELIVGDFVTGSTNGDVLVAPEWFPPVAHQKPYDLARKEFKNLAIRTKADTLLTSHGCSLIGNLKNSISGI